MKNITPIQIWKHGENKTATKMDIGSRDNNNDSASFTYVLFTENNEVVSSGDYTMTGTTYENYTSNEYAYNWVAGKLNITITG